jgi:hypothetical protein
MFAHTAKQQGLTIDALTSNPEIKQMCKPDRRLSHNGCVTM